MSAINKNQKYDNGFSLLNARGRRAGRSNTEGFTIIELLIASSVFSVVLLVALTGFIQVGRIFYKGVSDSQTQNVARQIVTDISSSLSNTSSDDAVSTLNTSGGYRYICIGTVRYTWAKYVSSNTALNSKPTFYDQGQAQASYNGRNSQNMDPNLPNPSIGLIRDTLPSQGTCPIPCINGSSTAAACSESGTNLLALNDNKPKEMLGDLMRINDLTVTKTSSGLYDVNVLIAYGSNDLIEYPPGDTAFMLPTCIGNSADQRFCAVQQLQTSMLRGGRSL